MFSCVKIIELASVLAGPSVGQFFSELGAEVIKVILFYSFYAFITF
jgi:crotonobetainyl-CoA:carnitine CoA-transferase CaiB-like acyl-CoA transferase